MVCLSPVGYSKQKEAITGCKTVIASLCLLFSGLFSSCLQNLVF